MDNQMEDSGHPMTRTPAVMEIENAISGLRLCVKMHRAGEELSGYRVSHCDVPVRCLETVLDAVTRTPAEPLADGEMIENLCRPIIGIDNRTALEAFDIMADRIRRCLTAYNPNDRLREALEPFAKVAEAFDYWCAEAMPSFSYPVDGTRLELAIEDCPAAIGQLTHADFAKARAVLKA